MDSVLVGLLLFTCITFAHPQQQHSVPSIFIYDDFERCEATASVYCYARTILRVDQFPAGFVVPQTESTDRIVHKHRAQYLELGVCLRDCEQEVKRLSAATRKTLFQPEIPVNFTFLIPNELFPTMPADKRRYETLVNVCVNQRLRTRYNITGYTALEYCRPKPKQTARPYDALEVIFLAVSGTLVSTLILTTLLDVCRVNQENAIVSAFSVRRNWMRLRADADSPLHRDLLYIDGLRVLVNHLVIVLHSFLIASVAPAQNYSELEDLANNVPMRIYLSSNAYLVQIFFTIGGYLLSVNFLRDADRGPIDARYAGNKILNRLVRLVPVYAFFLLFSVSLNVRFDVNVNGFRLFTAENAICRQNWWANVLFVNNFLWPKELCLMHTWYLAADLQLFLMAMGVLVLVHRRPKSVGVVFLVGVVVSFAVPGYITHQHKLHPVLPGKLSEAKFLTMYEPWIRRIYLPSYANTGCYLYGVIAGYLYHRTKNYKMQLERFWLYRLINAYVTPVLVAVTVSSFLWYVIEVPKPNLWVSLYSALYRNIIGIFVAVCFLRSIDKPPGILRSILSSKLLTTLGKLTYSAYVLHDVVMRFLLLRENFNSVINVQKFIAWVYIVTGVAFAGGLVVFLAIEQPMIQLIKPYISRMCPVGVKAKQK
ncbi:regulator of hypoxia-inducible factor 1-like [Anopheles arabiensis]|uniref:Acyltransferase 3 domain-containing protein n=1 Tax=Anopheles arabiensis TaxID=7173 RepID=A0A1Y9GLU4_ANOAR|nr:regulator of hypoxia-inducible factor 1-like [Anopheles arabiensis]